MSTVTQEPKQSTTDFFAALQAKHTRYAQIMEVISYILLAIFVGVCLGLREVYAEHPGTLVIPIFFGVMFLWTRISASQSWTSGSFCGIQAELHYRKKQ